MPRRKRTELKAEKPRARRPEAPSAAKHSRFQWRCPLCGMHPWTEGKTSHEGIYAGEVPQLKLEKLEQAPYEPELFAVVFGGRGKLKWVSYKDTEDQEKLLEAIKEAVRRVQAYLEKQG